MTEIKWHIRLLMLTVTVLLTGMVSAQSPPVISFVNEDGIYLRWQGQPSVGLEGYNVYRQSGSSTEWELLTETPLQLITDNATIREIAGFKTGMFLQLFGINDINGGITQEAYQNLLSDPKAVSFMEVMCLVNPKLGYLLGEIYVDSTVVSGERYNYRITSVINGFEKEIGLTPAINPDKYDVVPEVSGLEGKGLDGMNRLQWDRNRELLSSGNLVTYRLFRSDQLLGSYQQVNFYGILPVRVNTDVEGIVAETEEYLDKFLTYGQSYFYYVKGVNAFGIESEPGVTVRVTTGADVLPDPPLNLRAGLMGMNLKLAWDGRKDITGYAIYRSLQKKSSYEAVFESPAAENPFWIDTDIDRENTYFYYVVSLNQNSRSEPSDTLVFTFYDLSPPSAPMNVVAESDSNGITIRWTPNNESDIKGYEIERAADDAFTSRMLLNTFAIADTFYLDNVSQLSQTTYGYVVYAVDSLDNRSLPSEMVKARMPDIVAPQVPIITGLTRNGNQVQLSWTKAVEDDLATYRIFMAMDDNEMAQAGETVESPFKTEIQNSGKYRFAVRAVDEAGNQSPMSEVFTLTYNTDEFPPAPVGLSAVLNDDNHVIISWQRPDYKDIKGFYLMRTDSATGNVRDIGQLSAESMEFTDRSVKKGNAYRYMLKTYNSRWYFSTPEYVEIEIVREEE
ncbi:hypothetical protein [Saccharicrinis sp. FJH54]|uniref:hypothetical protein n=1 Tax=Saccharicrinis sp. FJH54 TaxID=3344665 RepID=UPI0035D3FEF1